MSLPTKADDGGEYDKDDDSGKLPTGPNPTEQQEEQWTRHQVPLPGGDLEETLGTLEGEAAADELNPADLQDLPETIVPQLPAPEDMPDIQIDLDLFNLDAQQDPQGTAFTPTPDAEIGTPVREATPEVFTDDLEDYLRKNDGRLPPEMAVDLPNDGFTPGLDESEFGESTFPSGDTTADKEGSEAAYRASQIQRNSLELTAWRIQAELNHEFNRQLREIITLLERERVL